MRTLGELEVAVAEVCRALLQVGLNGMLAATLLLLLGLVAAGAAVRHGPALASLVARVALAGACAAAMLSPVGAHLALPGWRVSLPSVGEWEARLPATGSVASGESGISPGAYGDVAGRGGLSMPPAAEGLGATVLPGSASVAPRSGRQTPQGIAAPPRLQAMRPTSPGRIGRLYVAAAGIWGIGTVALLVWLAICQLSLRRLARRSHSICSEGTRVLLGDLCGRFGVRAPRLRVSERACSPFLAGVCRPTLFLPPDLAAGLEPLALRALLAHELCHLARRDCAWRLLLWLACAAAWPNPFVWALRRRLVAVDEAVCDRAAVDAGSPPRDYARLLITLAERLAPPPRESVVAVGVLSRSSGLERRVRQVLRARGVACVVTPRTRATILALALVAVTAGIGVVPVIAAPPESDPFAADERMARKVAVNAEGIPLSDLLARLASATGVRLAAAPEAADEKVILFDRGRPLRAILEDLAALFHFRWERPRGADGVPRYTLALDPRLRAYETALLQTIEQRILAEFAAQAKAGEESPDTRAARTEGDRLRKRFADAPARVGARIYLGLDARQRQELAARGRLSLPFTALPAALRADLRSAFTRLMAGEQDRAEEERRVGFFEPVSAPGDLEAGGLRFEMLHAATFSEVWLLVGHSRVEIARVDSRLRWLLPAAGDPYTGDGLPESLSLPAARLTGTAMVETSWIDRLRRLAESTGVPVMADYYRSAPATAPLSDEHAAAWGLTRESATASTKGALTPGPEAAALNRLCQDRGYLWWPREKSLLFRKRDWYHQRRYEVSDRWLIEMAARLRARGGVPTRTDAFRVLELTPEQVQGLQSLAEPYHGVNAWTRIHELLALFRWDDENPASPLPRIERLPSEALQKTWLRYPQMTPRQREMAPAAFETYPRIVPPEEWNGFVVRLVLGSSNRSLHEKMMEQLSAERAPSDKSYQTATVHIHFRIERDKRNYGREIELPRSLPFDRRARTKVELLP